MSDERNETTIICLKFELHHTYWQTPYVRVRQCHRFLFFLVVSFNYGHMTQKKYYIYIYTACSGIVCKYAYLCMAEKASTSAGFPKCIKALISLKLIPEKENLLAVLIFYICNTEQLLHEGRCSAIVCNHNIIPFQGTVLQSITPILV